MTSSLSEKQLSELRSRLRQRLAELREEVRQELLNSDNAQYIELAGKVHDSAEQAVADLLVDIDLAVIDFHINEIRDIEAALLRLADGSYGICIDCGGEIGYPRLLSYPTAKRCHACQAMHERAPSAKGHPRL